MNHRRVIRWKFSFCNSYFICSSEKVKWEATSNMICIKKARRAGSTYSPGVMSRIRQWTIHWPCQNGSVRVLSQRELACSILKSWPLKKSHGSQQRMSCQQSVHGRCFSVGMNHLTSTIHSFKERHHLKLPAVQCDGTGSLPTKKLNSDREDGDTKGYPAPACQSGCYLTWVFFSVFNFSTWELLQLFLTCDLRGSEA